MSNEHEREAALNRFWNALISAEQQAGETDLTPEEMAVVRHLHRTGTAPRAGLSAEAAWPQVLARIEATRGVKEDPMALTNPASVSSPIMLPNGRAVGRVAYPRVIAPVRDARRWSWGQVATAALLLLTIVTSVVAVGWMRGAPEERPASLPAVLVATPAPENAVATLFSATLPAEMIPTEPGDRTFNVWHVELEPGARVPMTGQLPGPQITHVVAGELTLRVDGPLAVLRGGGIDAMEEQVPPGTEVVLQPGDTAVYAYDSPAEYANLGTTPVRAVGGDLGVGVVPGAPVPLTFIDYGEKYPLPALPPGPVQATIVQATLPPDGLFPAPPAGSLTLAVGESDISLGENTDGSLRNVNPREVTIYVLTLAPAGEAADTPTP
jgi:quercetin dioxygenase-like cupin family protein